MSKKEVSSNPQGGNVVGLPSQCCAEGCKQKATTANFCQEHFTWFKEGLLTKQGQRPKDFDKKYMNFMKKKAA